MKHLASIVGGILALGLQAAHAETLGVSDTEIKLGSYTDLSGPLASWGVSSTNGLRMRFDEANAAGGVHGRKINFIAEDMQYQIPLAVKAATKLMTSDKIFAFVSNLGTPPNVAVMPRTLEAGFPNIFPLSAGLKMYEPPHPLKLAYLLSDRDTVKAAVTYLSKKYDTKKICYQVMSNDYGEEVESGIKAASEKLGLQVTAFGRHKATETEFTAAVTSLKNSGCELLVVGTVARDGIAIYTTARSMGWNVPIVSSLGSLVPPVADNPAMDGFYTVAPFYLIDFAATKTTSPEIYNWYMRYKERFGVDPSAQSVIGYRMADIVLKALEIAGRDLTIDGFMKAFEKIENYKDPLGGPTVVFTAAKRYGNNFAALSQVQKGKWAVVEQNLPY